MRVRKKTKGNAARPRLCVFKSLTHIGAQLIDDEKGVTLLSYSTLSKEAKGQKRTKEGANSIGKKLAELAKGKKIEEVVFDRGRYNYHGLVAALAEGAREGGLKF